VGGGWLDTWMDMSVGVWTLGGYMDGCVGRWVVVLVETCMNVSVGVWCLVGLMDGCVGR
jgi:hypothetical protein